MKLEESQSVRPEGRMGRVPKVNLISDVTFSPRKEIGRLAVGGRRELEVISKVERC